MSAPYPGSPQGRLSQEEIEEMVKQAEQFAEQDKAVKDRIEGRNQLETYIYNMKSTVEDKMKDKISEVCAVQRKAQRPARTHASRQGAGLLLGLGWARQHPPPCLRQPPRPCRSPPATPPPLPQDDKEKIKDALTSAQEWLDENQEAEKDEFAEKLKEVQEVCNPIIAEVYKASGGPEGGAGGEGGGDEDLGEHDEL
jgi:heat shock protein 5